MTITEDILKAAGFEDITQEWERDYYKKQYYLNDYISLRYWTPDSDPSKVLKLDIDNALTNSGRKWHMHIDNCDCCTIGSADIETTEQFNMVMQLFDSQFRL